MTAWAQRLSRLAALGALGIAAVCAHADVAVPALTGRVVDVTGTLSGATVARLEQQLADLEAQKGSQVTVLVVPTTQPEEIEQFGIRVGEQWKLGRKKVDDGAILIVAKNDHRVRIEVGYGLEGALPDAICNRIIDETIVPAFKQGEFDVGVQNGVDRIIKVIDGEPLPPPPDHNWESRRGSSGSNLLPILLIVVVVAGTILRQLLGALPGAAATGLIAGGLAWFLSHFLPLALGAGVLAGIFALISGALRGGGGWTAGGGGWGGGGGFGGGGGGGGGFSGGGGSFGGGGASGSW